jgi:hypothetical protein
VAQQKIEPLVGSVVQLHDTGLVEQ